MRKKCLVISLMASAAILPGAALAQQPAGTSPDVAGNGTAGSPAAGANTRGKIEEVVVTAQKRSQAAQRTPIAIRVVSGRALQAAQVTDLTNLQRLAPDLSVTQNTIYTQLSIRGISSDTIAEGSDVAITVDIDGEYLNRPVGLNAVLYDLARIEVLKGPQGTLYGRNATGGAINIITAKPDNKYDGYFTVGAGNYGSVNLEGAVNIPVTNDLAVRLSGFHSQHGGYDDNGPAGHGQDANNTAVRASIQWQHDDFTAYVSAEYVNEHSSAPTDYGFLVTSASPGLSTISGVGPQGFVSDQVPSGNLGQTLPRNGSYALQDLGFSRTEQYHLRDRFTYNITDGLDLTYVGGYYSTHTAAFIPLSGAVGLNQFESAVPHNDANDISNDVRLSYKRPGGLFAQVGFFYFHEDQQSDNSIQWSNPIFGPPGAKVYVNDFRVPDLSVDSYAGYGQFEYPVLENLKLTGGLRYSSDHKRGDEYGAGLGFIDPKFGLFLPNEAQIAQTTGGVPAGCGQHFTGNSATVPGATIIRDCYDNDEVNWLAGVEYTPSPADLLYAKVSTAYRSGGFDAATNQSAGGFKIPPFQPEKIISYEIGSKNTFLNGKLQANLDLFRYDYTNLQVDSFLNTSIGSYTTNAGKATYNGVEFDGLAAVTDNDRLSITVNYLDARFDQYNSVETGIGGVTVPVNLAGYTPPQAPKWTIAAGLDHTFSLNEYGSILASVSTRYKSSYFLTAFNYAYDKQVGFTSTDISLTYNSPNGRYSIQGYAHNLENYRPIIYTSFTAGFPINLYNFLFGAPLTAGVQATYRF